MEDPRIAALRAAVTRSLPRLLSLCDRAPLSPTRGSPDRGYWHYRVDKDYPSATFAQVAWPLGVLATSPRLALPQALRERLAGISLATMDWWASIQHRNGSCDEWFPYERSHVATAFTTFGVAESARLLDQRFRSWPGHARVLAALHRAAEWLERHRDDRVANHAAGAVAALAAVEALDPGRHAETLFAQQRSLLELQHAEGYFPEYGGADPGYGSVTLAFLALAARTAPDRNLVDAARRLARFLLPFCQPDGSFGGEYGRRATRYAWLLGPALLQGRFPEATTLCARLIDGAARGALPEPVTWDDRYFCFFALPDAVATLDALPDDLPATTDAPLPDRAVFPEAGLALVRVGSVHAVVGATVGGVVKVHATDGSGQLLYDDCGYVGRTAGGRRVTSWSHGAETRIADRTIECRGRFCYWSRDSPVVRHPVAFRVFNRTVGRVPSAAAGVSGLAKRRYTSAPRHAPFALDRRIDIDDGQVVIRDRITGPARDWPVELRRTGTFAPVHVPSAPLWLPAFEPVLPVLGVDLAALASGGTLEVSTTVTLERGRAALRVTVGGRVVEEAEAPVERR